MRTAFSLWLIACLLILGQAVSPSFAQETGTADADAAPNDANTDIVNPDAAQPPAAMPDPPAEATLEIVPPAELAVPSALPPAPDPVPPPAPTCGAPANPWGFSYCGGAVILSPPASLCSVFKCIPTFWRQVNGYVMQCSDGLLSHSGGVRGSCSGHGGNLRPLYAPQ